MNFVKDVAPILALLISATLLAVKYWETTPEIRHRLNRLIWSMWSVGGGLALSFVVTTLIPQNQPLAPAPTPMATLVVKAPPQPQKPQASTESSPKPNPFFPPTAVKSRNPFLSSNPFFVPPTVKGSNPFFVPPAQTKKL